MLTLVSPAMFGKPIELMKEDDAVSPVIGVILMVAITVILAAVIAAFVLGIGDTDDVAPQSSISAEADDGNLVLEITSGDSIDPTEVEMRGLDGDWEECGDGDLLSDEDCTEEGDDEWTVGSTVTFEGDDGTDGAFTYDDGEAELEANLVWTGDGEDVIYTIDITVPE